MYIRFFRFWPFVFLLFVLRFRFAPRCSIAISIFLRFGECRPGSTMLARCWRSCRPRKAAASKSASYELGAASPPFGSGFMPLGFEDTLLRKAKKNQDGGISSPPHETRRSDHASASTIIFDKQGIGRGVALRQRERIRKRPIFLV